MAAHEFRVFADFSEQTKEGVGSVGTISDSDAHHLVKVLRLAPGDEIVVVSRNSQHEYYCVIGDTVKRCTVTITAPKPTIKSAPVVKSLLIALLKGSKNDLVCEQAAELGVSQIIFWQATNSVVRLDSDGIKKRTQRLAKIAETAARQSGQNSISRISILPSLGAALDLARQSITAHDSLLCCCFSSTPRLIKELPATSHCHILIGPESDFAPQELNLAFDKGFQAISLGQLRLRSETAAICAIASAQGLWGTLERC